MEKSLENEITLARDVFRNFGISRRNLSMYQHLGGEERERYVQPTLQALEKYFERVGPLTVRVKPFDFYIEDEVVFHDDSQETNVPYKFYREGFRRLTFEPGMTLEELSRLLNVLIQPIRDAELADLAALLWREELPHFSYILLEGFSELEEAEESEKLEDILKFLQMQIASRGHQSINFRGLSEQDLLLDDVLEGVQSQRGLRLDVPTLPPEQRLDIQELVADEEDRAPLSALELFLSLVADAKTPDDLAGVEEYLFPVVEFLLNEQQMGSLRVLVEDLFSLDEQIRSGVREAYEKLRQKIMAYLLLPERLEQAFAPLFQSAALDDLLAEDIRSYVRALGKIDTAPLLAMLPNLQSLARRLLLSELLTLEANLLAALQREYNNDPNILMDLLVATRDLPEVIPRELLEQFLQSSNPMVRMEALLTLASHYPRSALSLAGELIQDSNTPIRRAAIQVLSKGRREGAQGLLRFVASKGFGRLPAEDKTLLYRALGQTRTKEGFSHLRELLLKKKSFFRRNLEQQKLDAISGLEASEHVVAYKIAQETMKIKHSRPVQQALEQAVQKLARFEKRGLPFS